MRKGRLVKVLPALMFVLLLCGARDGDENKAPENSLLGKSYHAVVATMRPMKMLEASSAVEAPAYHRHLVRPGSMTSYLLRLSNLADSSATIELEAECGAEGWETELAVKRVELAPGEAGYVKLAVRPSSSLSAGRVATITVRAGSSAGPTDEITLEAKTTARHKIYFISIDSLGPGYLALNRRGTGPGSEGDWLMPNLRAFLKSSVYYPRHQAHLPAATDMNHASYLSGAYPGRLGLYSVQVLMFGFDEKGWAVWRSTPHDLMYWGPEGDPVTTIFNVVKDPVYGGDPDAFTAFVSGKDWVPEHYRNPVFDLDRIATVTDYPDYATPPLHVEKPSKSIFRMLESRLHKLDQPDFALWEDIYSADQAIQVIENEDPDVCYILLGGVDEAGHFFGCGQDLSEWDDHGTGDNPADDASSINKSGNREGILKTVRSADEQLGRLLAFLEERGGDDAYIVVESDHNMETNSFTGPRLQKVLPAAGYSKDKDYYLFTGSQLGTLFLRRPDPALAREVEKELEAYQWTNPVTGETECPMIVLNREEMKTGIDQATGRRETPPNELYSEYYVEHPKAGGLRWPDLFIYPRAHIQFPSIGAGFGNIGLGVLPFDIPPFTVYVGGHGGPSTQPALLAIKGPGLVRGVSVDAVTRPSDVAPTLYRLENYSMPESVQGKGLPRVDPTLR